MRQFTILPLDIEIADRALIEADYSWEAVVAYVKQKVSASATIVSSCCHGDYRLMGDPLAYKLFQVRYNLRGRVSNLFVGVAQG